MMSEHSGDSQSENGSFGDNMSVSSPAPLENHSPHESHSPTGNSSPSSPFSSLPGSPAKAHSEVEEKGSDDESMKNGHSSSAESDDEQDVPRKVEDQDSDYDPECAEHGSPMEIDRKAADSDAEEDAKDRADDGSDEEPFDKTSQKSHASDEEVHSNASSDQEDAGSGDEQATKNDDSDQEEKESDDETAGEKVDVAHNEGGSDNDVGSDDEAVTKEVDSDAEEKGSDEENIVNAGSDDDDERGSVGSAAKKDGEAVGDDGGADSSAEEKGSDDEVDDSGSTRGENAERNQSDAEDSDAEEKEIPEVNIESADENSRSPTRFYGTDSDKENDNDQRSNHSSASNSPRPGTPPGTSQTVERNSDHEDSDSDAESEGSEAAGLIADIFGESDDDEEFEGFEIETSKDTTKPDNEGAETARPKDTPTKTRKRAQIISDSEDEEKEEEREEEQEIIEDVPAPPPDAEVEGPDEPAPAQKPEDSDDDDDRPMKEDFISDFDIMMQKKKDESSKRRKRKDIDLINDSDDLIADIISQMRHAAEEDKLLNQKKLTATKKLKILPMVMSQLKKQDLKMAFLDQGVLHVIADWLSPLPDRSLPHLNIREGMIKQLADLPSFDNSLLKSSGVGRALMYLYKHPKETKENRVRAGKLITEWSRPIFNVATNYHSLTKEEREQRDYDHVPAKRRREDSTSEEDKEKEKKDMAKQLEAQNAVIKPGAKGWIGRARVPMPSNKDYVNRPKWNVEMDFGKGPAKKPLTRIEKHMRSLADKKRQGKQQQAITISIEGRKMAI